MNSEEYRFNVFGRRVAIVRSGTGWNAYSLGNDGKRGPLGIEVPEFITAEELREYLADIFHESARPGYGDVVELPQEPKA